MVILIAPIVRCIPANLANRKTSSINMLQVNPTESLLTVVETVKHVKRAFQSANPLTLCTPFRYG